MEGIARHDGKNLNLASHILVPEPASHRHGDVKKSNSEKKKTIYPR
jgi:hypothetical protein